MKHAVFVAALLTSSVCLADTQTVGLPAPIRTDTTVGALPACGAANKGALYFVSDALAPVALAVVAAGDTVQVGVTCNGTSFIVQ